MDIHSIKKMDTTALSNALDDLRSHIARLSEAANTAANEGTTAQLKEINKTLFFKIEVANAMNKELISRSPVKAVVDVITRRGRPPKGTGGINIVFSLTAIIISGAFTYFQNWKNKKPS